MELDTIPRDVGHQLNAMGLCASVISSHHLKAEIPEQHVIK